VPGLVGTEETPSVERDSIHDRSTERVQNIRADIDASVWQVHVEVGQRVSAGDELIILESMKMEIPVVAASDGVVTLVAVAPGDTVNRGQTLVELQ
jgi:biotin carboxyl carrier protein